MVQLVLKLKPYAEELKRTSGMISEFVNPKYALSPSLWWYSQPLPSLLQMVGEAGGLC